MTDYTTMTSGELEAHLEDARSEHLDRLTQLAKDYDGWSEAVAEMKRAPAEHLIELTVRTADKKKKTTFETPEPVAALAVPAAISELARKASVAIAPPMQRLRQAQDQRNRTDRAIQSERMAFHKLEQEVSHAIGKAREREQQESAKRSDVAKHAAGKQPAKTMVARLGLPQD